MENKALNLIIRMSKYTFIGFIAQLVLFNLVLASETNAQQQIKSVRDVTIEIAFEEATLPQVFSTLESITDYQFIYHHNDVNSNFRFNLEKQNIVIGDLLLMISKEAKLSFKQLNRNISVKQSASGKTAEKQLEVIIQSREITGKVSDSNNEGIPGVNIQIKGTSQGTITDFNGDYSLEVPVGSTLVFSSVGYVTEEVTVNDQSVINLTLFEDIKQLQELVIVGYGTQKKKDVTGSIASVDAEDIGSLPVPSVSDAMQGRAPGVQVMSSGTPGDDATFRIRGTGTINNSNPLLVINGVPVTSGLNQINPNDIESVQVLKDASATAIYGSRGANGVIIVQTKSGKSDANQFNIDYFTGIQQATNVPQMLNAQKFAAMHNDMMENAGLPENPDFSDPASLGTGTDWLNELLRTAPMQSLSASFSGGNENSTYYVSGNLFNQEGIVIETGYKRYSLQFNSDHQLKEWLRFGNNLTLNHDIKTGGNYNIRNTMAALPTQSVFDEDGTYAGPTGQPIYSGDIINPIGQARLIDNKTLGYNVIGSLFGEVEILENLKFKTTAGIQANFWDVRTWAPAYDWEPTPEPESYLYRGYNKSITWLWDNTLTYDKFIGDNHHITALVGTSAQSNDYDFMNGSIKEFASDRTQQLDNGSSQATLRGNASEWALMSYFGRLNYEFNDKYLATATVRLDGSSRFGSGNKYGVFPSGALAWRISNEDFFNVPYVNDLKIRAGYGLTGNQEIGNYAFASILNTVVYNFNGSLVPAVVPSVMPNPNVQWETQKQANIGIDATLFNERLIVNVDAYLKNTEDMLVPQDVPVSTGYSDIVVPYINAGKIRNRGVELNISSVNIEGALEWTTDFNISFNQNKVISLNDTVPMSVGGIGLNYNLARIQAGQPINSFFGFVTNGIFQSQEEVNRHATQIDGADPFNRTSAGDIRFADLNDDGVIDDTDRRYIGNPNPDVIFAVNNNLAYKGFDLGIFLQGISGNEIFNANRIWNEAMAVAQNQTIETLGRWQGSGTSNTMPRAVFNDPNKNTRASDRYIEDGSYLRVKNITLGYTLPATLTNKISVSRARIYASAQNLFTFTEYQGFDPEVGFNGIDNSNYPLNRTISVGVNLGF